MFRKKSFGFWFLSGLAIFFLVVLIALIIALTDGGNEASPPDLLEAQKDYSMKRAKEDGCVVMDGQQLLYGEKTWLQFVNDTEDGKEAQVRLYYMDSEKGEGHTVKDLSYDKEHYILTYYEKDEQTGAEERREAKCKYLVRSPWYHINICVDNYLISDKEDVSADLFHDNDEETVKKLMGNTFLVYNNVIDDVYYLKSAYDIRYLDIDNDGKEEKCCLGLGSTSGIFTFSLTVYDEEEIKYDEVYTADFMQDLRFAEVEGKPAVKGTVSDPEHPEKKTEHTFLLEVRDGAVELLEDGKALKRLEE